MLRKVLLANLVGIGLFLSASPAATQMPMNHSQPTAPQFQRIDQPIGSKIGVIAGGLALIGLELWWFLYSRKKA
ncbi:hypothetical protein [Myxacorys almedinensis]|nr:hypothetical protein [Myxacorys almedinensis]